MISRFIPLALPLLMVGAFFSLEMASQPFSETSDNPRHRISSPSSSPSSSPLAENKIARNTDASPLPQSLTPPDLNFRPLNIDSIRKPSKSHPLTALPKNALSTVGQEIWAQLPLSYLQELTSEQRDLLARHLEDHLASESDTPQQWLCWSSDSDPAFVSAYHQMEHLLTRRNADRNFSTLANQFLGAGKWTTVASGTRNAFVQGNTVTVTWSIVPDGTLAPGSAGSAAEASDLRSWLTGIYGGDANGIPSQQPWFPIVQSAFDAMEANSGLDFVYEPNDNGSSISFLNRGILGQRGDIRLSARMIDGDGNNGTNTLGFAFPPNQGDVVLDSADSFFNSTTFNSRRLFNVLTHELGHAIGLAHVCPIDNSKLMEPIINLSFRGPRFDEFYSLQRQYGDTSEISEGNTDNDTPSRATPLTLQEDGTLLIPWLSIDDNSDVDYFSLEDMTAGAQIQITVDPGDESYLEAPQTADCDQGTLFNAFSQQNLTLELLDSDGSTVLASSVAANAGIAESLSNFEFPSDGTYFIRINGGNNNAAQLYTMSLAVTNSLPSPEFSLTNQTFLAESGIIKNEQIDPGETVRLQLEFLNLGELSTANLRAQFSSDNEITFFPSELDLEDSDPNARSTFNLTFATTEECGTPLNITIELSDDSGYAQEFTLALTVGSLTDTILLNEGFEASATLPQDWSESTTNAGVAWSSSTTDSNSGGRSFFAPGVSSTSSATLTSPSFQLTNGETTLQFQHQFDTEAPYDGAVLEASLDEGEWFDLPTHPLVEVISGAYTRTLRTSTNPLNNRESWAGNSNGFTEASFRLPTEWNGQKIRFRWILGHDITISETGYYLDDVSLVSSAHSCIIHRPELNLTLSATQLPEANQETSAILSLNSTLPLLQEVAVDLVLTGTAEAADLTGLDTLILPAGNTEVSIELTALPDALSEENESLTLTLPADSQEFAPGAQDNVALIILEQNNFQNWTASFFSDPPTPTADSDGDGWSNLAEYFLGTNPTQITSFPCLEITVIENEVTLRHGPLPTRPDGTLGLETSPNLTQWIPATSTATRTPEGFTLPKDDDKKFLRLSFFLNP